MTLPGQMELSTVIDHDKSIPRPEFEEVAVIINGDPDQNGFGCEISAYLDVGTILYARNNSNEDIHKPAGIRLAKMLSMYDDQPSSQLWSDIQRLAREILK